MKNTTRSGPDGSKPAWPRTAGTHRLASIYEEVESDMMVWSAEWAEGG